MAGHMHISYSPLPGLRIRDAEEDVQIWPRGVDYEVDSRADMGPWTLVFRI